ncbi:hypothetical protein K474DRAFT_1661986 [Panus rudis PR-1116 ss-1]|nr:hypothetical protein K474DRAFT_1661986 [Panus rudis PR-1116 ss-1]
MQYALHNDATWLVCIEVLLMDGTLLSRLPLFLLQCSHLRPKIIHPFLPDQGEFSCSIARGEALPATPSPGVVAINGMVVAYLALASRLLERTKDRWSTQYYSRLILTFSICSQYSEEAIFRPFTSYSISDKSGFLTFLVPSQSENVTSSP